MSKVELRFVGEIYDNNGIHTFRIKNRDYFQTRIQKSPLGNYNVILDNGKENRSTRQNRLYWGIYLPLICEEHGGTPEELHEYFRRTLLPPQFITAMGKTIKIPTSTTKLKKDEFSEYIRKIEVETGVLCPNPCESGFFCGKKTCPICNKKISDIEVEYPENNLGETKF